MLFWLFVILLVIGIGMLFISDKILYDDGVFGLGLSFIIISFLVILISGFIISVNQSGADARIAELNARYESLVYQYENDIYDNDNDLGKRDLMEDIQEWNETISYKQEMQDNFWVGIYYPNIYDQFELIEFE